MLFFSRLCPLFRGKYFLPVFNVKTDSSTSMAYSSWGIVFAKTRLKILKRSSTPTPCLPYWPKVTTKHFPYWWTVPNPADPPLGHNLWGFSRLSFLRSVRAKVPCYWLDFEVKRGTLFARKWCFRTYNTLCVNGGQGTPKNGFRSGGAWGLPYDSHLSWLF